MIKRFLDNILCEVSQSRRVKRRKASIKLSKWELKNRERKARFEELYPDYQPEYRPVLPCGGTNPNWDKGPPEIFKIEYEDDDESFPAQVSRLDKWIVLKREGKEFEPEAVRLRELLDRSHAPSMKD